MRTSRELYHWIRWDPRFDPSEFAFGYDDHGEAPKEVGFLAFEPEGEIPWHRVLYLRRGQAIVWDRRAGVDRLVVDPASPESAARWPTMGAAGRWTVIDPLRFDGERWRRAALDEKTVGKSVSILSFNVLDEAYVPDALSHRQRFDALGEAIERAAADVVVLQEVTGKFFEFLCALEFVRARYTISHGLVSDAPQSVLVLSSLAVRWAGALRFSAFKKAIALGVETELGPLLVAGVHLPSDYAQDSRDLRRAYLRSLVAALDEAASVSTVIAGDFNEGDESSFDPELSRYIDAHRAVGTRDGATWEPSRNALARHASRSGEPRRLDRVWIRDEQGRFALTRCEVLSLPWLDEARQLAPSDHWPLRVRLTDRGLDAVETPAMNVAREPPAQTPVDRAVALLDAALCAMFGAGERGIVHRIGSHAMNAHDEESDLDVVAVVPEYCEAAWFFEEAEKTLRRTRGVDRVELIEGARVPIVRCVIDGLSVDIQHAARPERMDARGPGYLDESDVESVDPGSRRALLAAVDARALRAFVSEAGVEDAFASLVRSVKRWARARQVIGQAYGWMGGLSIAVLCAWSIARSKATCEREALRAFFEQLASWRGERAISLISTAEYVRTARDLLPVLAPARPARNVARSIIGSTKTFFHDEVARAYALVARGSFDRVDEAIEAPRRAVRFSVCTDDAAARARARGFVEGRVLRALLALDARGLRPRPLPRSTVERDGRATFVVGLRAGAAPSAREEFESAFEGAPCRMEFEW